VVGEPQQAFDVISSATPTRCSSTRAPLWVPEVGGPIDPNNKALSDLLTVLRQADPADKAGIYTQLGPRLVYNPQ
jgi:hypothetical protein